MAENIATVLETGLEAITAGQMTVQECLDRNPDLADELAPLLRAAEQARAIARPALTPRARARIEARFLVAAESVLAARRARASRRAIPLPLRRAAMGLALILACVALLGTSLIVMASSALPGSALYPVKLATEDVWLWLAPAQDEPELHLGFARRRLEEVQVLAERGRLDPAVLTSVTEETAAALAGAEALPPEAADPTLQGVLRATAEQQSVLAALVDSAPEQERGELARALETSQAHHTRALRLAELSHPPQEPAEPDGIASAPTLPVETAALPSRPPEPSDTPVPSSTSTMVRTLQVPTEGTRAVESVGPTGVPLSTATFTPSPQPSRTSEPIKTVQPMEISAPTVTVISPTETPVPTLTPISPTGTLSPTATPVSPTEPLSPTATPISPTEPLSPTITPVSPSVTPTPTWTAVAPTATPISPTETVTPSATPTPTPPTATPEGGACVHGPGRWKDNPDAWPVSALTLGDESYDQAALVDLLGSEAGGDASLILAQALIAAELNGAAGADSAAVAATTAAAHDWLADYAGRLPYRVGVDSAEGKEALDLADVLEQYNAGTLPGGPARCP